MAKQVTKPIGSITQKPKKKTVTSFPRPPIQQMPYKG
jgi:hypothetical protein